LVRRWTFLAVGDRLAGSGPLGGIPRHHAGAFADASSSKSSQSSGRDEHDRPVPGTHQATGPGPAATSLHLVEDLSQRVGLVQRLPAHILTMTRGAKLDGSAISYSWRPPRYHGGRLGWAGHVGDGHRPDGVSTASACSTCIVNCTRIPLP